MAPYSSEILEEIKNQANPERRAAIERVVEACDALAPSGVIKLSKIERYICATYGSSTGPRAQSISNERKNKLGMYHYVTARIAELQNKRKNALVGRISRADFIDLTIESIADMDVRNMMRELSSRLKATEGRLARAQHVMKTFRPGIDFNAILAGRRTTVDARDEVAPEEITALGAALHLLSDPEILARCGLVNEDGLVRRKLGTADELLPRPVTKLISSLFDRLSA